MSGAKIFVPVAAVGLIPGAAPAMAGRSGRRSTGRAVPG